MRALSLCCLLACILLSACGGGGGDDSSEPTPTPTAPGTTPVPTPTPTPTSVPTNVPDAVAVALLAQHNSVRSNEQAGLPALSWSERLATFAQTWADHLASTNSCNLTHRSGAERQLDGTTTGENLFAGWVSVAYDGYRWNAADVVGSWAGEKPDYDFSTKSCAAGKACGHYTQIVWKTTTQVGCGRSRCAQGEVWVCNYLPAGNYVGQNPY
ncbi:CAP domain-containing protein [Chitiniphilus eburneus]|uniref:SCP-like extracellular n=1 Tax=Chitiniphilus eburneus TaxID=2571148 RepID=A0A4U0QBS3_9NEIS|nr:CAP domain-containing protein [Chitiniphilus eburneus]TJZ78827.1 SCP-like extracellular [Chitiniphilus eburneus]